jgi:hypothetical protein
VVVGGGTVVPSPILHVKVSVLESSPSDTVTETEYAPMTVELPLITPVSALTLSPGGNPAAV